MSDTENIQRAEALNQKLAGKTAEEVLKYFLRDFEGEVSFSTSLGAEDQAITHIIAGIDPSASFFTLDTGRLFQETYDLMQQTNARYGINIKVMFPDKDAVEQMVNEKGINLFYESIENRRRCCHVRKVEPLQRAFKGLDAWICGLRREQSVTRQDDQLVEWDATNGLIKINPLIDWTEAQVWAFIKENNVPYNKLHDEGFASIGCLPCTRAILPGEDIRAGRWWWENPDTRECGLHKKD
ncbi:MAG: phosphoadenylyl-sulfate reductase [Lentimicrobium sp.]|jgi:phosphoadenosine phosphosulfate reductase|nr:phosphoadenylyl-sulfate reductase [Lentimicrobium sp.]